MTIHINWQVKTNLFNPTSGSRVQDHSVVGYKWVKLEGDVCWGSTSNRVCPHPIVMGEWSSRSSFMHTAR